jgi:hypothetical protein
MTKLKFLILLIFFFNMSLPADEFHLVQKSENLSTILYNLNLKPIYGKHGTLNKVLALNPKINNKKNNIILAGQEIRLFPTVAVADSNVNLSKAISEKPQVQSLEITRSISSEESAQFVFFKLRPQVSWMKITSNNSNEIQNASVSSSTKSILGIAGQIGINLSEKFSLELFSEFSTMRFYGNNRYYVSKSKAQRENYGFSGTYQLSSESSLKMSAGFYDEFFLTVNRPLIIDIEQSQLPEISVEYRKVLKQYSNVVVDAGLFGKIILPYNNQLINGKLGSGLGGDVVFKIRNKGIRFFYNYSDIKATNKSSKAHELGWSLIYEGKFLD